MSNKYIKMPSNKNFGIVFSIIFLIICFYPLLNNENIRLWSLFLSLIFLFLGFLNSKILTPLNKFGLIWNFSQENYFTVNHGNNFFLWLHQLVS